MYRLVLVGQLFLCFLLVLVDLFLPLDKKRNNEFLRFKIWTNKRYSVLEVHDHPRKNQRRPIFIIWSNLHANKLTTGPISPLIPWSPTIPSTPWIPLGPWSPVTPLLPGGPYFVVDVKIERNRMINHWTYLNTLRTLWSNRSLNSLITFLSWNRPKVYRFSFQKRKQPLRNTNHQDQQGLFLQSRWEKYSTGIPLGKLIDSLHQDPLFDPSPLVDLVYLRYLFHPSREEVQLFRWKSKYKSTLSPLIPSSPFSPLAPCAPLAPVSPIGPRGPIKPIGP